MIYLDNAATTRIASEVLEAMMPYLTEEYGNPGSVYGLGQRAAQAVKKAREQVAGLIGAEPEQVVFTSGGTEANNLAILGLQHHLRSIGQQHIITTLTEHKSVLEAVNSLCTPRRERDIKQEFYASFLSPDRDGVVRAETLRHELNTHTDTGLVSVMFANNEVGAFNDVYTMGLMCKERGVLFHTDCVQAAGTVILDVNRINCDLMSLSSHKIHGAKGVGALYVRDKKYLSSVIHGGSGQEFGLRGGTENVAGIVGFGKACELAATRNRDNNDRIKKCGTLFCRILNERLSGGVHINGLRPDSASKTLSLTFSGVDAETLVLMADVRGLCISAGSACQSHESKPSHVFTAMGLSEDEARSTVRVSFSEYNTESEAVTAAEILADCVKELQNIGAAI